MGLNDVFWYTLVGTILLVTPALVLPGQKGKTATEIAVEDKGKITIPESESLDKATNPAVI